jgi:hypothetical protein
MNYENFKPGFNKPTIIMGQQYGIKVSVELDHSDTDIDQLFDAFETICVGLGYHADSWKKWIIDRADEYRETDAEDLKEKLSEWRNEDVEDVVFHSKVKQSVKDAMDNYDWSDYENQEKLEDSERYRATEEDEAEFDDYGKRIEHPTFEWGDEPEEDYDGQFGDWKNETPEDEIKPNKVLIDAKKQYDKQLKMNSKKKKKSK